jgi:hypothetical protein
VETAFISNPQEEKRLNDHGYQDKLARAILEGIREYVAKHPPRPQGLQSSRSIEPRLAAIGGVNAGWLHQ